MYCMAYCLLDYFACSSLRQPNSIANGGRRVFWFFLQLRPQRKNDSNCIPQAGSFTQIQGKEA